VDHCIFYGCKNALVLIKSVRDFSMPHSIVSGAYEAAVCDQSTESDVRKAGKVILVEVKTKALPHDYLKLFPRLREPRYRRRNLPNTPRNRLQPTPAPCRPAPASSRFASVRSPPTGAWGSRFRMLPCNRRTPSGKNSSPHLPIRFPYSGGDVRGYHVAEAHFKMLSPCESFAGKRLAVRIVGVWHC
jgi:hypothetical protein